MAKVLQIFISSDSTKAEENDEKIKKADKLFDLCYGGLKKIGDQLKNDENLSEDYEFESVVTNLMVLHHFMRSCESWPFRFCHFENGIENYNSMSCFDKKKETILKVHQKWRGVFNFDSNTSKIESESESSNRLFVKKPEIVYCDEC